MYFRALYCVAKLCGFAPYKFIANETVTTKISWISTGYSFLVAICANIAFVWSLKVYFVASAENRINTLRIIFKIEQLVSVVRNVVAYVFLIWCQHRMINSINYALRIMSRVHGNMENFLDFRCTRIAFTRFMIILIQIALMYSSLLLSYLYTYSKKMFFLQMLTKLTFSNGITIVLSPMHFAVCLVNLQFFRLVNNRLSKCIQRINNISQMDQRITMRMQMYCDVSDEIDRTARMYKRVLSCANGFTGAFSWSMLVILLNSTVSSLAGVLELTSHFNTV